MQVYRKDLYDAKGLKPADTYDQLVANAKALNDPASRIYGLALRGFAGAGQNMYIYPSLFRGFGGSWMQGNAVVVNSPEAVQALQWYVDTLTAYAPPAVRNWNWPDIADAFSQGTVATYIDAHSSAAVINNPEKSKVVGKIAYARWPKGPNGKRVTSIWNWGFPINAALTDKQKKATWLFIEWAASAETQARTSWKFAGPAKRSGINRMSLWRSPEFAAAMKDAGDNFIPAALESLEQDTDVDWRPRVPQWPAIGETMATAIQSALVGQKKPKEALDEAQARIRPDPEGLSAGGAALPAARAGRGARARAQRSPRRSAASRSRCSLPALAVLLLTTTAPLVYLALEQPAPASTSACRGCRASPASTTTPRWAATRASGIRSSLTAIYTASTVVLQVVDRPVAGAAGAADPEGPGRCCASPRSCRSCSRRWSSACSGARWCSRPTSAWSTW